MQQVPPGGGPSLYDKFVQLHLNESAVTHDFANFLPWHREFLLQFEQALQKLEPGVVIPYWDAALDAQNPETSSLWNDATFGGNGNPNLVAADGTPVVTTGQFNNAVYQPFHHISLIDGSQVNDAAPLERQWSSASGATNTLGPFESAEQLNSLMTSSSYDKFRQALDYGEHGLVHNDIGGDMLTMASPDDPVFWMFHAWIDYVWSQWQAISPANANAYGGLNADGSAAKLSDTLPGFAGGVTVGSVMSIHSLCYGYQPLSQSTPAIASDSATEPPAGIAAFGDERVRHQQRLRDHATPVGHLDREFTVDAGRGQGRVLPGWQTNLEVRRGTAALDRMDVASDLQAPPADGQSTPAHDPSASCSRSAHTRQAMPQWPAECGLRPGRQW